MGVLKMLQNILPRNPLITIHKLFIRLHLDYRVFIYDHSNNERFNHKIESNQHTEKIETYYCRTDDFKNSFFPHIISEWNNINPDVRNSDSNLEKIS